MKKIRSFMLCLCILVFCVYIATAFEAELETPQTKPPITKKVLNSFCINYDYQADGGALQKATVTIQLDYWNTEGTPFIIETKTIIVSGVSFFDENIATANSIKAIIHSTLIAEGEITAEDEWL